MFSGRRRGFFRRFDVRTTAGFAALLALAVLVVSTGLSWSLRHNLYREADESLEAAVREMAYHRTDPRWTDDLLRADLARAAAVRSGDQLFFRYYDASGREVWTIPETMAGRGLPPDPAVRNALAGTRSHPTVRDESGEYLTFVFPIAGEGGPPEAFQAGMSVAPIEARSAKYACIVGGLGVLVVIAGAMVSHRLVRRPLREVHAISARAREISATALDLRLPESGSGDEFDDLSRTLNGMLARLEDSVRRLTRFTGDAAHELRGPLTRMRAAAEVSLQGARTEAELREVLADVVEQAGELGRLVNDLLFLAREDAGAPAAAAETLDGPALLGQVLALYEGPADEKGVAVRLAPAEPGNVRANRQRLLQALANLVENAVKFTDPGGRVDLGGTIRDGAYHFVVRDTGCGMAPEHLPHIFDRFYRADPARTPRGGGAGLGLSIVRAIAAAHGGRVDVQSEVGRGSTFTLVIPLAPDA